MITTTTKSLLESSDALRELSNMSIPVRTALKLRKILRKATVDMDAAQDTIKAIAEKYAKKDEAGNIVHPTIMVNGREVPDESRVEISDPKAYSADMKAVFDEPVSLDFDLIKADDLSDPKDPMRIKTSVLFALDWLLEG